MPKTNSLATVQDAERAIADVLAQIRSVLRKYPRNTLPANFADIVHYRDVLFRTNPHTKEILVFVLKPGRSPEMVRIPDALLGMQQSAIHAWTRHKYWGYVNAQKKDAVTVKRAQRARLAEELKSLTARLEVLDAELAG